MAWNGRKDKTYQDLIPSGRRPREAEWERRRSWMAKHHPMCVSDWIKYKS